MDINQQRTTVIQPRVKKHKAKPKVSELDPIAAKKRRTQTRLAQKAFRQRKDDALASLEQQVIDLHKTIDGLNTTFLALTDVLATSGWLGKDTRVANEVKKAIEKFLEYIHATRTLNESNEEFAFPESIGELPKVVDPVVMGEDLSSLAHSAEGGTIEIDTQTGGLYFQKHSPHLLLHSPENPNQNGQRSARAHLYNTRSKPSRSEAHKHAPAPQRILSQFQSTEIDLTSLPPISWQSLQAKDASFSRRLHGAALQGGFRLACEADRHFGTFQRVFNCLLDFHTRESLILLLTRVMRENFEKMLEPPEASPTLIPVGDHRSGWLNATEVALYFREKGFDFDKYPFYAELDTCPANSDSTMAYVSHDPFYHNAILQPRATVSNLSREFSFSPTTYSYFQHLQNFEDNAANFLGVPRHPPRHKVTIDVTKLIREIVVNGHTLCLGRNPAFRKDDLDHAVRRAIIQDIQMPWTAV